MNVLRPSAGMLLVAALLLPVASVAESWTLEASAWARPRDGRTIVTMAPLPAVARAWSRREDARIVVRYAGGEDGELWASELADWLVALGIPGSAITLTPGGRPGRLALEITEGNGS
jgi:hypothetical protein